jgi:hypothetical protein
VVVVAAAVVVRGVKAVLVVMGSCSARVDVNIATYYAMQ